jgi:membrane dipeptidase
MRKALAAALLLVAQPASVAFGQDLSARAEKVHRSAIVIDTHLDVPYRLEKEWVDLAARNKTGHVDIPRMKEGGLTGGFFAAYVPAAYADAGGAAKKALEQIDLIHRLVARYPDLQFADSVAQVREAKRRGKIGVLIGIEGGHAIENSLGSLGSFYRLGVRYMTLTHTNTNGWADSSGSFWRHDFDPKKTAVHDGLNDLGRDVVLEMNRLGMLVDISHVSDETLADVLEASQAPVFASHSSCRALANIPRNLTDDQIRAIAAKGGVVMVNIGSMFLEELEREHAGDTKKRDKAISDLLDTIKLTPASWTSAVDHIERILKVGGPEAVGIGSDFDGIEDPPEGLEDISRLPRLTQELLRRGHSDAVVRGVLGENFLKFWARAEAAKTKAPAREGPLPFSKP